MTDKDSYPLPAEKIAAAVADAARRAQRRGRSILAQPRARRCRCCAKAYAAAKADKAKLTYARLLAVLGDAGGLETLLAEVAQARPRGTRAGTTAAWASSARP